MSYLSAQKIEAILETRLVKRMQSAVGGTAGQCSVSLISFVESALPLPILTDPFLMATIMANRMAAFRLVVIATASSVFGGLVAYGMAWFFLDTILLWLSPELVAEFQMTVSNTDAGTFVLTLIGAVTPIPYTLVCWAVAALEGNILLFILASLLGRGLRYGIVGYLTYRFGPLAVRYSKQYLSWLSVFVLLAGVVYFFWRW